MRLVMMAVVALAACAPSRADREAEHIARSSASSTLWAARAAQELCQVTTEAWRAGAKDGRQRADERCRGANASKAKAEAQLEAYRAACLKCASAEKCESEVRRIRDLDGRGIEGETACP